MWRDKINKRFSEYKGNEVTGESSRVWDTAVVTCHWLREIFFSDVKFWLSFLNEGKDNANKRGTETGKEQEINTDNTEKIQDFTKSTQFSERS